MFFWFCWFGIFLYEPPFVVCCYGVSLRFRACSEKTTDTKSLTGKIIPATKWSGQKTCHRTNALDLFLVKKGFLQVAVVVRKKPLFSFDFSLCRGQLNIWKKRYAMHLFVIFLYYFSRVLKILIFWTFSLSFANTNNIV